MCVTPHYFTRDVSLFKVSENFYGAQATMLSLFASANPKKILFFITFLVLSRSCVSRFARRSVSTSSRSSHTFHQAEPFQSSLIMSLAFSAIMYAGAFVWPAIMIGITLASTTLRPSIPCTRSLWSTTPEFLRVLILHVPAKWPRVVDKWRATQAQYASLLKVTCLHPGNGTGSSVVLKRLNAVVEATSIAWDKMCDKKSVLKKLENEERCFIIYRMKF